MLVKYFLLLSIFLIEPSFAQFDLKYGGGLRTYPGLGAAFEAESGYTQVLWGENSKLFKGMIRPGIQATHSVVVNDYDASLTFYPVSFLGFSAGHKELYSRFDEFVPYDCTETRCIGTMKKDYLLGKIALAWGKLFATASYAEFRNSYNDPTGDQLPVAEYEWVTAVNPNNERSVRRRYFAGYILGNGNILGLSADYREFEFSRQRYAFQALVYQVKMANWRILFGAGSLGSTVVETEPVGVIRISHILAPSVPLF